MISASSSLAFSQFAMKRRSSSAWRYGARLSLSSRRSCAMSLQMHPGLAIWEGRPERVRGGRSVEYAETGSVIQHFACPAGSREAEECTEKLYDMFTNVQRQDKTMTEGMSLHITRRGTRRCEDARAMAHAPLLKVATVNLVQAVADEGDGCTPDHGPRNALRVPTGKVEIRVPASGRRVLDGASELLRARHWAALRATGLPRSAPPLEGPMNTNLEEKNGSRCVRCVFSSYVFTY
jgi:hypothetical protein